MSTVDSLPGDQRAVLQLVLGRGRSYDEIAGLLKIRPDAVRDRAVAALNALGPETAVEPAHRAMLTDYLLGQLPEPVIPAARDLLATSPPARAWTRVVGSEVAPLAAGPLPEIPAAGAEEAAPAEPTAPPTAPPEIPPAASVAPAEPPPAEPPPAEPPPAEPPPAEPSPAEPSPAEPPPAEPPPARPQPEPVAAPPPGEGPPPPPPPPDGDGDGRRRSSRLGGLLVLAAAAIAIAVALFFVLRGGSPHHNPPASAAGGALTSSSTSSTPSSSTSSTPTSSTTSTTTGTHVIAQVNLTPPPGSGSKAAGIAQVVSEGSADGIAIAADNVPPNTSNPPNAYAVWLYNSPTDAKLLGFVNPGVSSNGRLSTAGGLPSNASHYKQLIIALETTGKPKKPGKIILEGPLTGL